MARDRNDVGRAPYHSHAQFARKIVRLLRLAVCLQVCVILKSLLPGYLSSLGLPYQTPVSKKALPETRTPSEETNLLQSKFEARGVASLHGRNPMSNKCRTRTTNF